MTNQIVISRIQNRRGIKENLPQPLLPGEFALTVDTGELWIGTDPAQPPWGIRTYGLGGGDISSAETIVDTQIVSAKFSSPLSQSSFDSLVTYLTGSPTPAVVLTTTDILWDELSTVFIAADTGVDAANTIANIVTAIGNSPVNGTYISVAFDALGAINDPTTDPTGTAAFDVVDGDFLFTIAGSNAAQGSNAASLINKIHGAQLVTTLSNLQVTTSGVGVGSSTFRDMTVTDTDSGFSWAETGTASADSVTDELTFVSGTNINIDIDTVADAIRITSTTESDSDILYSGTGVPSEFTLTASTASMTNISGLAFDLETPSTTGISDVIFIEYSANIGGSTPGINNYTVAGIMQIVGNILVGAGTATLQDSQVEVRDGGLAGVIAFQALYVSGAPDVIQIQYTNTFTSDVIIRVVRRRWSSF